jgi:mutator protein MutT
VFVNDEFMDVFPQRRREPQDVVNWWKMSENRGQKKRVDVAIAVIARDQSVLICKRRAKDSFGGFWEFPGGKRESGESLRDCLHREMMEELGITVRIGQPLTPIRHDYPHVLLTLCPFLCQLAKGIPQPLASQQLKWIRPSQLKRHRFPPANVSLLDEVAKLPMLLEVVNQPIRR